MKLIDAASRHISNLLLAMGSIGLLLMLVQTVIDVVADNFFSGTIPGNIEVISIYYMALVVFLPLAYVERIHEHISVDLVWQLFPRGLKRASLVFAYLCSIVFLAILTRQTWFDAVNALEKNEMFLSSVLILIWPAKFFLPVSFAAMLFVLLGHLYRAITDKTFLQEVQGHDAEHSADTKGVG